MSARASNSTTAFRSGSVSLSVSIFFSVNVLTRTLTSGLLSLRLVCLLVSRPPPIAFHPVHRLVTWPSFRAVFRLASRFSCLLEHQLGLRVLIRPHIDQCSLSVSDSTSSQQKHGPVPQPLVLVVCQLVSEPPPLQRFPAHRLVRRP